MPDEQRLADLMEAWMADRDNGLNRTAVEMCADCPELATELKQRIGIITRLENLGDVRLCDTLDSQNQSDTSQSPVPVKPGASDSPPEQRRSIGGFKLLDVLGEGGMGAVYLAEDHQLHRRVAVKVMKRGLAADPEAGKRFLREVRAMAAIEHDNIMTIYSVGEDQGTPFLVMPALRGETLESRLQREGRLPLAESIRIGQEIADGLAAAHAHGLIHRDIKPSNVWLEEKNGRVRILDFGLARPMQEDQWATRSGVILGTPAYMAPEQAASTEATPRSDLFSLGAVLYRMITGIQPFAGANLMATLNNLTNKTPQAPAEINPEVPADLSELIEQLLAKSPDQRPQSAEQLSKRLRSSAVTTTTAKPTSAAEQLVPSPVPVGTVSPTGRRFRGPGKPLLIALGSLMFLLAFVVYRIQTDNGVLILQIDDDEVEARLSKSGLAIEDLKSGRTWHLKPKVPQDVDSGDYKLPTLPGLELLVRDDSGAEYSTREFSIRRGDRRIVRASLAAGTKSIDGNTKGTEPSRKPWSGWPVDGPKPAIAPFDAKRAKAAQEEWATSAGVPVEYTNSIGMRFRLVPPGEFLMGSTPEEIEAALKEAREAHGVVQVQGEAPQHTVILTQPIFLGVHEVTQKDYARIMNVNPSYFSPTGEARAAVVGENTAENPVEAVTWYDAIRLSNRLSELESRSLHYEIAEPTGVKPTDGNGYRLPSEAEWEFACRAGASAPLIPDESNSQSIMPGWYQPLAKRRPHPVGTLPPNAFGFHDMTGNVWEWVQDWYDAGYYGQFRETPAIDPTGPAIGVKKMFRGGSWTDLATWCRPAYRANYAPTARIGSFGVRLALSVASVRASLKHEPEPVK